MPATSLRPNCSYRSTCWIILTILGLFLCQAAHPPLAATQVFNGKPAKPEPKRHSDAIDFDKQVKPIFAKYCISCHGPKKVKSRFRVDRRKSLIEGGDYGEPMIVPGKPDESRLIKIIEKTDDDLSMPPSWVQVPPAQVAILKQWIRQGAKMPKQKLTEGDTTGNPRPLTSDHWSLQPVSPPEPPKVVSTSSKQAIDRFIARRLGEKGLRPSTKASRQIRIRRLYLVMLGVPPTPGEVDRFVNDKRKDAWVRLVDQVLADHRYGERWAQHWLDIARYGESDGFETNRERPNAWYYRDWVIQSFNDDKPYDQFVKQQIAGDALNDPVGTGFLVAGPHDIVKSPDINLTLMQRQDELADVINTSGTAFLGLTLGCARCHDHKFDPITQTDYYALQAVFSGVQHGERAIPPDSAQADKLKVNGERIRELEKKLAPYLKATTKRFTFVDDSIPASAIHAGLELLQTRKGVAMNPAGTQVGQRDDPGGKRSGPNLSGGSFSWWENRPGTDVAVYRPRIRGRFRVWISWGQGIKAHTQDARYVFDRDGNPSTKTDQEQIASVNQQLAAQGSPAPSKEPKGQPLWSGFRAVGEYQFDSTSSIVLRSGVTGSRISADLVLFELIDDQEKTVDAPFELRKPVSALHNVEWFEPIETTAVRFEIKKTNAAEPCIDEIEIFSGGRNVALASDQVKVTTSGNFANDPKHQLKHLNDGKYGNRHSWISNSTVNSWVQIEFAKPVRIDRIVWARDREGRYKDRTAIDYEFRARIQEDQWKTVARSANRLSANWLKPKPVEYADADLTDGESFLARWQVEMSELIKTRQMLRQSRNAYIGSFLPRPPPTHRLHRGDPLAKREQVAPDTVRVIGSLNLDEKTPEQERRLAFARWVANEKNPLTPRVIVNRIWQYHFGTGIVSTSSDFGANGTRPTHPGLLDWLARDLIANRWSLKSIHRKILLSDTWQQSSQPDSAALEVDAGCRLLWRFPPRRLEAEAIRDSMVFVSGVMNPQRGGPGFSAFEVQLENVRHYFPKKKYGPDDWRRMIYMTKIRQERESTFGAFDCPDGSQVIPNRGRSTTPLQALNLFNSEFVNQQAGLLAKRLEKEVVAHVRAKRDLTALQVRLAFRVCYSRDAMEGELESSCQFIEQHGLKQFCRAMLNSNEFVFIP